MSTKNSRVTASLCIAETFVRERPYIGVAARHISVILWKPCVGHGKKKMTEPTEQFVIPEPFCTDVTIEDLGHGIRGLVFSSPHVTDGKAYQRAEARIIMPAACLPNIRNKLTAPAERALVQMIMTDGHDPSEG